MSNMGLTRQTCMKRVCLSTGFDKTNIKEMRIFLSMGLTRKACMRMKGLPKHETNKENMHEKGFNHEKVINPKRVVWFRDGYFNHEKVIDS